MPEPATHSYFPYVWNHYLDRRSLKTSALDHAITPPLFHLWFTHPDEHSEYHDEADHDAYTRSDHPASGDAASITGIQGVTSVTKPRHVCCWNSTPRGTISRPGRVFGGFRNDQSSVLHIGKW